VFLHISTVELAEISGLREGQKVTFDIVGEGDKANAVNLRTL
jgi:cold shock CspA family protein